MTAPTRCAPLVKPSLWDFDAFIRTLSSSFQFGRVRRQKLLWFAYWELFVRHDAVPFEATFIRQTYGPVETSLDADYERTGASKLDDNLQAEVKAIVEPLLEMPTKALIDQSHRNPAYCSGEPKTEITQSDQRRARTDHLLCTAAWHLRDKPYAAVLYGYALTFGKQKNWKRHFYLSVRQLADYFGWDKKTLCPAIADLHERGFFQLIRKGTGPFASEYAVLTHKEWCQANPNKCRATVPSNGTQKAGLVSRSEDATVPFDGLLLSRSTGTQSLIVNKERASTSLSDVSNQAEKKQINLGNFVGFVNEQTNNNYSLPNPTLEKKILRQLGKLTEKHNGNLDQAKLELSDAVHGFADNDFYMARGKHSTKNPHSPIKVILGSLDTCEELAAEWRRKQEQE